MGQVVFIHTWLNIPDENRRQHDLIQALINERKAEFLYETREYNEYQREISKQKSHHLWRNRMKLVVNNGLIVEEDSDLDE